MRWIRSIKSKLLFILVLTCSSCKTTEGDLQPFVEKFAEVECRAIELREHRFKLADSIRFATDSLLNLNIRVDSSFLKMKLEKFEQEKTILLQQSLQLADSIQLQLSILRQDVLKDVTKRAVFDDKLNAALQRRGCIKKT